MSKTSSKEVSNNLLLDNLLKTYLESKPNLEQNQNPELEVKFGTRGIRQITKINFDNVIQQLLSNNFKFQEESKYYLRINTNNIRTEIIGLKNIQEYCRTNKLPTEITNQGYSFTEKKGFDSSSTSSIVNFDDFNFRVSYNIETSLSPSSPIIENLLKTWIDNKKFYRLINRFTMKHDEYPVLIDLSIVRESRRESSHEDKYNLKESNIFNLNQKYEIEIELDNDMLDTIDKTLLTSNLLDKLLKKIIKYILSGLQETNYPISYTEQNMVINNYLKLIKKDQYKPHISVNPRDFIGPSSSTLQMINIAPHHIYLLSGRIASIRILCSANNLPSVTGSSSSSGRSTTGTRTFLLTTFLIASSSMLAIIPAMTISRPPAGRGPGVGVVV